MGGRRSTDTVKSYVFSSLPLRAEGQPESFDGWTSAVEARLAGAQSGNADGSEAETFNTSQYLHDLTVARGKLLQLLQHTSSSPAEVAAAQSTYLGLLVEADAVEQAKGQDPAGPVLRSTWFDVLLPLAAFKPGGTSGSSSSHGSGHGGSSSSGPGSRWFASTSARKKQLAAAAASAQQAPAASSGVAFELAQVLLAGITWKLARAGSVITAAGGADSTGAMEAYQLYCQAAGQLAEIHRKALPQLDTSGCGDLQREVLSALHHFALGEAQNVMLQRGVALNYQGSTLAPMATDTAMLFSQAYEALEAAAKSLKLPWNFLPPPPPAVTTTTNSSSSSSSSSSGAGGDGTVTSAPAKNPRMAGYERLLSGQLPSCWPEEALPVLQLAAYVQYQVAHCYCLASICGAEMALSSNQAGQAVALAQLGSNLSAQLQDLGFEQSSLIDHCTTLGMRDSSRRLGLQSTLEQKAAQVLRRCQRENRTIYFQFVPEQPSSLPWPQRSAQPEIFRLPNPQGRLTRPAAAKGLATANAVTSGSCQKDAAAAASTAASGAAAAATCPAAAADIDDDCESAVIPAVSANSKLAQGPADPHSLAALAYETVSAAAAAKAASKKAGRLAALSSSSSRTVSEDPSTAGINSSSSSDSGSSSSNSANEEASECTTHADTEQEECSESAAATDAAEEKESKAVSTAQEESASGVQLLQQLETALCPADTAEAGTEGNTQVVKAAAAAETDSTRTSASYTLPAVQDVAAADSADDSTASSTADSGSSGSSRRGSSSSGSGSWSGSSTGSSSYESDAGMGGFFSRMFGCCVRPECGSEDAEDDDESSYDDGDDESVMCEECDDQWDSTSMFTTVSMISRASHVSRASVVSKASNMSKATLGSRKQQQLTRPKKVCHLD